MNILLVGCGKMGGAMLTRWRDLSLFREICIVDPETGVKSAADIPPDFRPNVVVFAVKPQTLPDIISGYQKYMATGTLFLSIAAGKSIAFFEQHLGADAKVVRAMPNTPAAIGRGITVACANKNVSIDQKMNAEDMLSAVGEVLWVNDEKLINPVTALSGSGPAYVFLLIETLEKAGISIGLDPKMAEKLARATVIGSGALAEAAGAMHASKLRENVTSPGGTTEAALKILMRQPGMQDLFNKALADATKRAEELSA